MGTLNYKIIDNFLEKKDFLEFQKSIFQNDVPWFYRNSQVDWNDDLEDLGYFSLCFFNEFYNGFTNFDFFLKKIYKTLGCNSLIQSRANLTLKSNNQKLYFHNDYPFECFTAIFYMNNNNGGTMLDVGEKIKIENKENRMLVFNSQIKHSAVLQSDVKRRIVININYF
jgi:hypothetical protein